MRPFFWGECLLNNSSNYLPGRRRAASLVMLRYSGHRMFDRPGVQGLSPMSLLEPHLFSDLNMLRSKETILFFVFSLMNGGVVEKTHNTAPSGRRGKGGKRHGLFTPRSFFLSLREYGKVVCTILPLDMLVFV